MIRNAAYCCEHMHRAGLVSRVCASGAAASGKFAMQAQHKLTEVTLSSDMVRASCGNIAQGSVQMRVGNLTAG
jgi:hypothetical protein